MQVISYVAAGVYLGLFVLTLVTFCCSKFCSRRQSSRSVVDEERTPLLKKQDATGYSVKSPKSRLRETTLSDTEYEEDLTRHPPMRQASPHLSPQASPQNGATGYTPTVLDQNIEKLVNKVLGEFVKMIKEGMSELNIPSLDPLKIPGDKDISISAALVNVQGSFSDFSVAGLSLMSAPEISLKDQKVTATTTTKVEISGKYSLNGRVSGFISINSNNTFKCTIGIIKVTIGISYKDPKKLNAVVELKSTNIEVKLNDAAAAKPILSKIGGPIANFIEESL